MRYHSRRVRLKGIYVQFMWYGVLELPLGKRVMDESSSRVSSAACVTNLNIEG